MVLSVFVFLFTLALAFGFAAVYYTHIFQLEAYLKAQYFKWLQDNFIHKTALKITPVIIGAVLLLVKTSTVTLYISSFFNVLTLVSYLPKKAKKPFVCTARVKRLLFTEIILFAVSVFFAYFLSVYPLASLGVCLAGLIVLVSAFINSPVEKLVRNRYINEAKRIIASRKKNLVVIGITGSYGKTSTKYFLAKILSKKYNVLMTPASYNTTMGVVKVIRENLKPSHEVFICEMGARRKGEIKEICDIVLPDHAIITSVGPQHLETFGSIENIIETKLELALAVGNKGYTVVNGDNDYLYSRYKSENIYYGIDNDKADVKAKDVTLSDKGTTFAANLDGNEISLCTRLIGKHNVQNILACVALAHKMGVDSTDIAIAVRTLEAVPHRLELIDAGKITIIDDSFNSNPSGSAFALDALSSFDGVKILVTPGMIELGEKQKELNENFGKKAAEVCDYIYIVGKYNYESIYSGIASKEFDMSKVISVSRPEQAVDEARRILTDKKVYVLLENDLPDNFE